MKYIKYFILPVFLSIILCACSRTSSMDLSAIPEASREEISRIEPLNWWVGMKTPLQLLVQGKGIGSFDRVSIEGGKGIKVKAVSKAESPNYLFIDIEVAANAEAGEYQLVFSDGTSSSRHSYELAQRRGGSAERKSFTTADLIYLIMPDRFANGDSSNDNTDCTLDKVARNEFFGRHGGDIKGIADHLDYLAELGVTAIWNTPLLEDNEPESSYHGYACTDYYHIDSRFGSNEDYRDLVASGHEKGIKMIAINTLGSLYILENGNTINSFADLRGKTIYATGKGANPEYVLNYLLEKNGLTVGEDVFVDYTYGTEHAQLATALAAGECAIGMLPEPNVSSAMTQNKDLRIALNLNEEWDKVADESSRLTMGCVIVRNEFFILLSR